jgi:hypothetical protein
MRIAASWLLYVIGDMIYYIFDRLLRVGLPGALYTAYSGCMSASARLQGALSGGPWVLVNPEGWDD